MYPAGRLHPVARLSKCRLSESLRAKPFPQRGFGHGQSDCETKCERWWRRKSGRRCVCCTHGQCGHFHGFAPSAAKGEASEEDGEEVIGEDMLLEREGSEESERTEVEESARTSGRLRGAEVLPREPRFLFLEGFVRVVVVVLLPAGGASVVIAGVVAMFVSIVIVGLGFLITIVMRSEAEWE